MKSSARLLATVKPERFLTPGNPTGLTGLLTHPAPRTQLLYYYSSTLQKLSKFPEHSVYRQSTEAITKQRYDIVAAIKPAGYEEWAQRAQKTVDKHPEVFGKGADVRDVFLPAQLTQYKNPLDVEWDGRNLDLPSMEGTRMPEEKRRHAKYLEKAAASELKGPDWENEPPLEAEQIAEIENQIGAGLIEEVIEVAEGENKLVDTILESRSWEELEEKPPQGQWDYFTRDQHTPGTQEPPKGKN
ncbi:MAG: hypothetical protein LQ352_006856 [Teloschistes flavicans]|nr:MAG: hypothetical protein LQ352_006856 [Teloschistes flavicans]